VYLLAKKQRSQQPFTGREWLILAGLLLLAAVSAVMLFTGRLAL
jgi:uncharacterized membrane protein YhhN